MKKTRLTELLGIEYPIIQGGMVWVSNWRLAAAVSNAGGLGQVGSGSMDWDQVRENIRTVRENTNKPWGLNIPMMRPDFEEICKIGLEEGARIFTTSAGNPLKAAPLLKHDDTIIIHVVPSVKGAKKAQEAGFAAIVCEGYEAGGHNGMDETCTISLVPQVVDAVNIPVAAAGGIADGRGIAAALALGADGVQMGTRFVATVECPAHENFKRQVVEASDTGTLITGRKMNMLRSLKNDFTLRMLEAEKGGAGTEELLKIIGDEHNRAELGMVFGEVHEGVLEAGQSAGLVQDIPTVAELFKRLVDEYEKAVAKLR
ncbi:MAG: nitronate monooxygenase [Candidatus Abyssobacteria bacterium SURF_17]|uniref:Nitronate monooxygenase n=1 Tax=Candidatus Abyssobacteria bacterium SURF_17 TaxID=2093361 RepID=A0A419F7W8_9BACT|nr:MAG: nitronate monooxygenase [Candidatus Abyssubacteria bacterium SURF_17]